MKTNKKLKVAIGIVIAIIVLAILGVTTITKNHALAAHTHEWVQGSGSHTCSICGLSEECDFVTNYSNIDETYHWTQKCSKCGAVKGIAKHNTQWKNDSTYHWEECKDCGAIIHKGNHVYHSSNPGVCMQMECAYQCKHPGQTGSTCSICYKSLNTYTPCLHTSGYKYEGFQSGGVYKHEVICNDSSCPNYGSTINIVNCTRGPWIQTDNLHLVGCSVCYQKMEQGDHVDANNDGKCDVCTYEMEVECTHPSSKVEWKYNETSHWQYCNECKKDITEKVSHDIIMNEVYSPTCTEKGYTHHQCKCGYEYITDEVPALGHNYGSWVVTKPATCTTEGEETRTCTRCGNKETRKTNKIAHTIVTDSKVEATCTQTGKTEGKHCSVCGIVTVAQETIPALGHNYGSWVVTKSATCTTEGEETRTCTRCGNKETRKTNKTSHTIVIDQKVSATCTQTGKTEGRHCSVCGTVIVAQEATPALGHNFGGWVVTKPATCTTEGEAIRTCSRCPEKEMGRIDKLAHTVVTDPAVSATCTEKGKTEGSHCSECGEIITAQTEIPALGHNFGGWTVIKEATCTETGTRTTKCSRCNETETETISAKGHTEVTDLAVSATCTEKGKTAGSHCSVCGEVIKAQTEIPALGHDYVIEDDNGDGTHTEKCTRCGDTKNVDHEYDEEGKCICGAVKINDTNTNTETENNNNENTNTETENNNNENTNTETENNNNENTNTETENNNNENTNTETENNNNENTNTETENNNNENTNTEIENNNNENTNTEIEKNNNTNTENNENNTNTENDNANTEKENNDENTNSKDNANIENKDDSKEKTTKKIIVTKNTNKDQSTKNIPFTGETTSIIAIGMLVSAGFGIFAIKKYKGI